MSSKISTEKDLLNEEFYQVNKAILGSFHKYRPPLNIYKFKEDVSRVVSFYEVGGRLSNEQIEEMYQLVDEELIFFSRADYSIYVKHISHQLDLVILDRNLKEHEIVDVFIDALTRRVRAFLEEPLARTLTLLQDDLAVLVEYLVEDIYRTKAFLRRLHPTHNLAEHSFNSAILALSLYVIVYAKDFSQERLVRKKFDRVVLGFFIHDVGMTKMPAFVRDKKTSLANDEMQKVTRHPTVGYEMLTKLDLKYPEIEEPVLRHHEKMTGNGYPGKISGKDFTMLARIMAVADTYAAMLTNRAYAKAKDPAVAIKELIQKNEHDLGLLGHLQNLLATANISVRPVTELLGEESN